MIMCRLSVEYRYEDLEMASTSSSGDFLESLGSNERSQTLSMTLLRRVLTGG